MSDVIKDGTGSGNVAKVDASNRLSVLSHSFQATEVALLNSAGYSASFGVVTLTSANESAVIYIKNNNDSPIVVTEIVIISGDSTGASDKAFLFNTYVNPTGGTLITDELDTLVLNRDLGSSKTATVTAYKGSEGKTLTGGSMSEGLVHSDRTITSLFPSLSIPKGFGAGFSFQPASGNTSIKVSININFYIKDEI